MKLIIDTDKLAKEGSIGLDELLYLTSLALDNPITLESYQKLSEKGLIITNDWEEIYPGKVKATPDGVELMEHLYAEMEIGDNGSKEDRFEVLANKLRELFPTGRKDGTQLQWRDSTKVIAQRLKAFIKRFNENFTDEEILDATKRYVESFNGSYRFMQVLKYFIMKSSVEDGITVTNSQLLSYLQNKEDKGDNSDWTVDII